MNKLVTMLVLLVPGLEMIALWTVMIFLLIEAALHGSTSNLVADIMARGDVHPISLIVGGAFFLLSGVTLIVATLRNL